MRWTSFAADPNAPAALAFRRKTVLGAQRKLISDRTSYLREQARGKRVLDVGVVDHSLDRGPVLHKAVAEAASYCLGVDILAEAVDAMKKAGYNVRLCDITRDTIDDKFDIMIAGEVIEHLGNPAGLFEAARRVLVPGGRFILTTPNPYYLARIRNGLFGRVTDSADHVSMLFPSSIAEMAEREGFVLDRYAGIVVQTAPTLRGRVVLARIIHGASALGGFLVWRRVADTTERDRA